jgi:hypothetical protein
VSSRDVTSAFGIFNIEFWRGLTLVTLLTSRDLRSAHVPAHISTNLSKELFQGAGIGSATKFRVKGKEGEWTLYSALTSAAPSESFTLQRLLSSGIHPTPSLFRLKFYCSVLN